MKQTTDQTLPRARDNGLLIRELDDELLVYDLDRHKAHCLNKTAVMIWNQCDGEKTVAQIAAGLSDSSGTPISEEVVWLGLTSFEKTHLLTERVTRTRGARTLTRRDLIRKVGIAAAVGLPLVTSILSPRASEAATCKTSGTVCGAPSECCSGMCAGVCG